MNKRMDRSHVAANIAAAALFLACPSAHAASLETVSYAIARQVLMAPTMEAPGTIVARNDAHVAADVDGKILWVAQVGDILKSGDPVARLDDRPFELQVASDTATVDRLRAALHYDEIQTERMARLANSQAIAPSTRDEAISTRDQDKAQLAGAVAALNKSRYDLDHSVIRAPFPGRVAARLINPGEYALAGKDIVRLVDIDDLEVSVPAPIRSTPYLKAGAMLTMETGGRTVEGSVRAVVPVGDVNSRTIELRLTIPAADAVAGDAARVLIPSAPPKQVIAVPRDALVLHEDNTYVFRIGNSDRVDEVAVETGTEEGLLIEIRGDIRAGDRIVVSGLERLQAGEKVIALLQADAGTKKAATKNSGTEKEGASSGRTRPK